MYKGQSITVIIPCLNEEQGIEKVLRAMPDFVDEVIVVDNNSTDRTSEVAAGLGAKVIREEVRGYGRSYKRGFAVATSDLIDHARWRPQLSGGCALVPDRGLPAPGSRFPECFAVPRARPARHELQA